ncbi:helix-turn-helix domain-containing protein [Nocardia sp. Marseille-Q1738]
MGNEGVELGAEARFGRRVRAERLSRGWTQAELAERLAALGLNLHPSAIAKIELRDVERPRAITLDEAEILARAFGLTVGEMYETDADRVRNVQAKMRAVLDGLSDVLADGNLVQHEVVAVYHTTPGETVLDAHLTTFSQLLSELTDLVKGAKKLRSELENAR